MNSFIKNNRFPLAVFNLTVIYLVGIAGICFTDAEQQAHFLKLTPLNLAVTTGFLLLFHKKWNSAFYFSAAALLLAGFFVEVAGVHTGMLFGNYNYGSTLGLKLLDVPLIIGLNWFLLVYGIAAVFHKIQNIFVFAFVSAAVMTLLDVLIEPIAIKLDFWHWQDEIIPLQNFAAWFVVSFFLFYFFRTVNGVTENRFALVVVVIQFIFFGMLNLLL
jgi:uncharacterized membrane protein